MKNGPDIVRVAAPRIVSRVAVIATLALLAASTGPRLAGTSQIPREDSAASWELRRPVTTIGFHRADLAVIGLAVVDVRASAPSHVPHPLFVAPPRPPSFAAARPHDLRVLVDDGRVRGFAAGGRLRLRGGFRLAGRTGDFDFASPTLRPGATPFSLELLDASGEALLTTAQPQWELDDVRGRVRYLNADLRILPEMARRLGDERLAGKTIGVLALDGELPGLPRTQRPALSKGGPPPCGDWSGEIDVALIGLDSVSQGGASSSGRIVVVPSVTLKNVGTANVPWYGKFSGAHPPYGNDQHPFLVWQMARVLGGVLEPIGRSQLKHAFATSNDNCQPGACTDLHILGLGCEDLYGFSSNTWNAVLGPRSEVTASTGVWAHCNEPVPGTPSHFDPNADCIQEHNDPFPDYFVHGMKVAESALGLPGARYFVEAFYVIRDDVDVFDSMGLREVVPTPGIPWTFPAAAPFTLGPIVDAWVDPSAPGPGADSRLVDTGEGHLQLATRVLELGGAQRRFAYALQNLDFDRRIRSFHVPVAASVAVTGIAFADGDGEPTTDWVATRDATGVTWTAPVGPGLAAELDWGTLLAFRFDADQGAIPTLTTLGVFEPGSPSELRARSLAPGTTPAGSDYHTVTPCRLFDTRSPADGAAPLPSGRRRTVEAVGRCGIPAAATALALNVTITGPTGAGSLMAYSADLPRAPAASTFAFGAGATRASEALSMLSPDGKLALFASMSGTGSAHVVVDVMGYFAP